MKDLIKKFCTKEVIFYIIFGVSSTVINLVVTWALSKIMEGSIASAIGILTAVLFAYFTNRKMVFNSQAVGFKENLNEFWKFMIGRAFTMLLEEGGVILFNTILKLPLMPVKLVLTVIVIITNYFLSKFFAFTKKDNKEETK